MDRVRDTQKPVPTSKRYRLLILIIFSLEKQSASPVIGPPGVRRRVVLKVQWYSIIALNLQESRDFMMILFNPLRELQSAAFPKFA
jgi:hypothetical protein